MESVAEVHEVMRSNHMAPEAFKLEMRPGGIIVVVYISQ
jgi:hypothetical protein